jgi:hypothetical protein
MGINKRYVAKFDEAYKDLKEIISPIEFEPNSPYYHQEEWREVLPCYVPGVVPSTYWISNMGRVYTNLKSPIYPNGGIMKHSINQKGYHQINLKSVHGNKIGIKIAKLVMLHFRFVPGCQYFEVDHLDGNKDHNCLWNFEWVNSQENTHRAIKNGQRSLSPNAEYNGVLLTDEQARSLFKEAIEGYHFYFELAERYNVPEYYIKGLVGGSIRPYIRKEYYSIK